MKNKIKAFSLGVTFYSLTAFSANDSLCRNLVKKSFDDAISEIVYPKHIVEKERRAVDSYIDQNPLKFMKNQDLEVIGVDSDTPVIKVAKDTENRTTAYSPIKLRSSSLLVNKESAQTEFPFLDVNEAEKCKIQTLVLGSEQETQFPIIKEKSKLDSTLIIHALYCGNGIRAFKYSGKTTSEYYEKDSVKAELMVNKSPTRGFIFEILKGECVLKSKLFSVTHSENVNRDQCIQFYSLMNSSDKLTENASRDESAKNVCYTKPAIVVRGKNLSTYIPNNVWNQIKGDNIEKLILLAKSIQSRNVDMGNISFAETLNRPTITDQDIIRGCEKNQVTLSSIVERLDDACADYRTFIPILKNQSSPRNKAPDEPKPAKAVN